MLSFTCIVVTCNCTVVYFIDGVSFTWILRGLDLTFFSTAIESAENGISFLSDPFLPRCVKTMTFTQSLYKYLYQKYTLSQSNVYFYKCTLITKKILSWYRERIIIACQQIRMCCFTWKFQSITPSNKVNAKSNCYRTQ